MKNLVLTINFGNIPSWAIHAKASQLNDWFKKNVKEMPFENIIIMPDTGTTALYWLEGDVKNPIDRQQLDELKKKLQPVLHAAIDDDYSKEDPQYKKAMDELKQIRLEKEKNLRYKKISQP